MPNGRGRYVGIEPGAMGYGLRGTCYCPSCGYEAEHTPNNPCSRVKCPSCGKQLKRRA